MRGKRAKRCQRSCADEPGSESSTYQVALGCERKTYWTHTHRAAASRTDCPSGLVNGETGSPGRDTRDAQACATQHNATQDEDEERKNERKRKIRVDEWTRYGTEGSHMSDKLLLFFSRVDRCRGQAQGHHTKWNEKRMNEQQNMENIRRGKGEEKERIKSC